jgi:hypothetical protein
MDREGVRHTARSVLLSLPVLVLEGLRDGAVGPVVRHAEALAVAPFARDPAPGDLRAHAVALRSLLAALRGPTASTLARALDDAVRR